MNNTDHQNRSNFFRNMGLLLGLIGLAVVVQKQYGNLLLKFSCEYDENNKLDSAEGRLRENYYKRHASRGHVLIFNQESFDDEELKFRDGSRKDEEALTEVFSELNFTVDLYRDKTHADIRKKLKTVASMDHSDSDSIIVVVMSHGINDEIFVQGGSFNIADLQEPFKPAKAPTLAGKPKLFFIQACRGQKFDEGFELENGFGNLKTHSIPTEADFLVMYATTKGKVSWRNTNEGSPFIQSLAKQLRLHHNSTDLLSILTYVNREVASTLQSTYYGNFKQMCSIDTTLTRKYVIN